MDSSGSVMGLEGALSGSDQQCAGGEQRRVQTFLTKVVQEQGTDLCRGDMLDLMTCQSPLYSGFKYQHACACTYKHQNSINLPFLYPLPMSTYIY